MPRYWKGKCRGCGKVIETGWTSIGLTWVRRYFDEDWNEIDHCPHCGEALVSDDDVVLETAE